MDGQDKQDFFSLFFILVILSIHVTFYKAIFDKNEQNKKNPVHLVHPCSTYQATFD